MLALLLLASPALAATSSLNCLAIYRTLDESHRGVEERQALKVSLRGGSANRHEAELRGRFFSVVEDQTGDLLLQITVAPDYTKGNVSRARPDSTGQASLSDVDGVTVYRLECRK